MRHSRFVPLVLALAALTGYAVGARPAQAQAEPFPFQVGDVVMFEWAEGRSRECRVDAITGAFALCAYPADRQASRVGRREPPDAWVNVTQVQWVNKSRQER